MNKLIYIILLTLCTANINSYKITVQQKKTINHAKSLEKSGLKNEAEKIYTDLLMESPYLKEALMPISLILKNKNIKKLKQLAMNYQSAYSNSIKSKIETFEILLWTENQIWKNILDEIKFNKSIEDQEFELILNILFKNNKINEGLSLINHLRETKSPDFFAFQLGIFYSINMEFEKATKEYLLYAKLNNSKRNIVRNRIMAFPDFETISSKVINILINDKSSISKILLADIYIKREKYEAAYKLIQENSKNENDKIQFIKNLIRVKEFGIAQKMIDDILNSSQDKIILRKTILELAKIYENLFTTEIHSLPLTSSIIRNQFLDSQFIKINNDNNIFLTKAINIYDSLRINSRDSFSTFQLAEIKYRILGDLDGATKLYNELIKKKDKKLYNNSLSRIIDIKISKGNLQKTLKFVNEKITSNKNDETQTMLKIKKIQILFYLNNKDELKKLISDFLNNSEKNNLLYNDILKINSSLILFDNREEEFAKYSLAMLKIYQNKRVESIELLNSINEFDSEAYESIIYQSAYLYFLQNNFEKAISLIDKIDKESAYIESSLLLKAEIYDYILNDKSKAVEIYLYLLETFPESIHYDKIRQRLRSLAS